MNDETAGISCINCGYEVVVTNKLDSDRLQKSLRLAENGNPICPDCDNSVTYEDYISERSQPCTYPDCLCPLELPHTDSPCAIGRNKESGNAS